MRGLITFLIITMAIIAYTLGFSGLGVFFILLGLGLESWFWLRVIRQAKKAELQ